MALEVLPRKLESTIGGGQQRPCRTPPQAPTIHAWPRLQGPLVWDGASLASPDAFTLTLSESEVSEVHSSLRHFHSLGLYGSEVSTSNFSLPTLGPKLRKLARDVHSGTGVALVRGLRPDDFSAEDNTIVYLGIASYIGSKRGRQDEDGNMLTHICDSKLSKIAQDERPTRYSTRASTFHTDTFCDILALQTRRCAAEGGRNILASSWTIYNKIAARRPELLQLLAEPIWPFDSRGRFFRSGNRPLLFFQNGRAILNFAREPLLGIHGVRRAPGLAHITPAQQDALDYIEEIARESQLILDAEPGDLLFINNHAILHSREAFRDEPEISRYLVRLWLKSPDLAWKLPGALQEGNDRIYECPELGERWNIVDLPKAKFRLSERLMS